jgi:flagellin-specific chaperone FliS
MDIIDSKSPEELLQSLIAEAAKAQSELRCAQGDIRKANSRLQFVLAILNDLLQRSKEDKDETITTSP